MRNLYLLSAVLLPSLAQAASFQRFDVPGATTTCGAAISGPGIIAGESTNGSLQSAKPFLYDTAHRHFTFPAPQAQAGTLLFLGVTRNRIVLVSDILSGQIGATTYLYRHGTTTPLTTKTGTPGGINDTGTLIGNYADFSAGFLGFVQYPSGRVKSLNDGSGFVQPMGIDAASQRVVGYSGNGGFYYDGKEFHVVSAPGATAGTMPHGVDTQARVSGTYFTGTTSAAVANGFLLRNGAYTTYNVPGATFTAINAANDSGQITGCYADTSGTHGFYDTP